MLKIGKRRKWKLVFIIENIILNIYMYVIYILNSSVYVCIYNMYIVVV